MEGVKNRLLEGDYNFGRHMRLSAVPADIWRSRLPTSAEAGPGPIMAETLGHRVKLL